MKRHGEKVTQGYLLGGDFPRKRIFFWIILLWLRLNSILKQIMVQNGWKEEQHQQNWIHFSTETLISLFIHFISLCKCWDSPVIVIKLEVSNKTKYNSYRHFWGLRQRAQYLNEGNNFVTHLLIVLLLVVCSRTFRNS